MLAPWYQLCALLPAPWSQFLFLQHALLAILLLCPLLGLLGTLAVGNRMAFFADAVAHASLTGLAIGVLLGATSPLPVMLVFAALFATVLTVLRRQSSASTDTHIGICAAAAVALGLTLLSRGRGLAQFTSYLAGDLLSIAPAELLALAGAGCVCLLVWWFAFNRFLLASFNPALARSRGDNIAALEFSFSILLAMLVTLALPWVGLLVINALLIIPAAAARNLSRTMRGYHGIAVGGGLCCGLAGLALSYYADTATGATVALLAALWYFITVPFSRRPR
ncbi:MAG TPA: metal ABC transporter permease [bacterium]|nr:metal ABC transporter permease [bacterium]